MATGQKHAQLLAKDSTIRFPFHEKSLTLGQTEPLGTDKHSHIDDLV